MSFKERGRAKSAKRNYPPVARSLPRVVSGRNLFDAPTADHLSSRFENTDEQLKMSTLARGS